MIVSHTKTFWIWETESRWISFQQIINLVWLWVILKHFLFWNYRFTGSCISNMERSCVSSLQPSLSPGNHCYSFLHFYNFVTLRMLHKWNHAFWDFFFYSAWLIFIQVVVISGSFLFVAEQYLMVWMYHSLFHHSPSEGHFGCFHFLAFTNKGALNNRVHDHVFIWK